MRVVGARTAVTLCCLTTAFIQYAASAHADGIRAEQWHLRALRVAEAHRITDGKGTVVAVVDTGVDPHPDLKANLLPGTEVIPGKKGNGQLDLHGHGTSMAGLIAAQGAADRNGALGIAPAAKILPVKFQNAFDPNSGGTIAAGVQWAAAHGADVINISAATAPSLALQRAVKAAATADAVVVAATGNVRQDVVAAYPAAMPGVLSVGASNRSGKHAEFSVPGPNVQICAPGVDMLSTRLSGKYFVGWGTSESTAIVSGAAALVRAKYPNLSAQQVIHRLTATATDIGKPGRDDECGFGVLNVVKALTADVPLPANSDPGTGSAGPTAAPTADAAPSAGGDAPAPDGSAAGSNTPMVVGGAVAVIVLLGGLLALLAARRRRSNS